MHLDANQYTRLGFVSCKLGADIVDVLKSNGDDEAQRMR